MRPQKGSEVLHSERYDVAELSAALPPQVLLPRGQIPFWLTAEGCRQHPRRSPAATMSFGRAAVARWRHDTAM